MMQYEGFSEDMDTILGDESYVKLDFSIPEHAEFFLKCHGGKDLLETKYKAFYNAFLQTKSLHESNNDDDCAQANSANGNGEKPYIGILHTPIISSAPSKMQVNSDSENTSVIISGKAESKVNATAVGRVLMYGCIEEPGSRMKYASIDGDFRKKDIQECEGICIAVGQNEYTKANSEKLSTKCTYEYYSVNNTSTKIDSFIKRVDSHIKEATTNTIDNIEITAPYATKDPKTVRVGYNGRSWIDLDYHYAEVAPDDKNKTIAAMLPISGKIKFKAQYTPIGLYIDSAPDIHMNFSGGNSVSYNQATSDIAKFFTISGQEVSFTFRPEWLSAFSTKRLGAGDNVLLQCDFRFKVKDTKEPAEDPFAQSISIFSNTNVEISQYYKSTNGDVRVPAIQFFWGCFGKDTMILMADKTQKKISDIQAGEMVETFGGEPVAVKEVTGGIEDIMLHIETENGKNILLTRTHPILTERGIVQAYELDITDVMVMQDGTSSPICHIYAVNYSDQIYNLDLGSSNMVFANGFVAGDLYCQNSKIGEEKEKTKLSPEAETLFAEMDLLSAELKEIL